MATREQAERLVDEVMAMAGVIRAIEEPPGLGLTADEEACYEMGLYFGSAAWMCVLQERGLLSAARSQER
jgi:hypothetical protein